MAVEVGVAGRLAVGDELGFVGLRGESRVGRLARLVYTR
jgi:hypothetical protein